MPERPFSRDMNRIRLALLKPSLDTPCASQRNTNFRIARHRQSSELVRADKLQFDAERARFAGDLAKGAHDAIDLRMPSVGRDQNPHEGIQGLN